jgi:hypothetical protein
VLIWCRRHVRVTRFTSASAHGLLVRAELEENESQQLLEQAVINLTSTAYRAAKGNTRAPVMKRRKLGTAPHCLSVWVSSGAFFEILSMPNPCFFHIADNGPVAV